ncbi:MAG TPA: SurA N-terminal domain-containing protein [Burkholderiaceae bacterium]|jgi:peptidyl-prolyl cis-trans isomerase D|nr:SurA N-terminal domain-containing protein [Burkholderiaceae bacterium]
MFDFVRTHTRMLQFVLLLLIFPSFVIFGIQGYSRFTQGHESVAKVDGQSITQTEWDAAHRQQVERMRAQMPGADLKLFDSPEMKQRTLDALVRERVILTAADKLRLATSDERLQRLFQNDPQFAAFRRPDGSLNRELIASQGISPEQFERQLRQDLSMRQVMLGVEGTAIAPASATETALEALFQRREVQIASFDAKNFAEKVQPTDAQLQAYYDDPAHAAQFQASEQANIEYVQLDLNAIKAGISVSEDDLKKYYAENESRYSTPEERRASHILVKADKSAPAAEREKARAKAQSLLAEVRKHPESFADIAKKNSDDPGSAAQGGDLDYFGRGAMVKAFEDAAFSLKPGQISDVVESDFGFHIIKVTDARGGEKRSFDAVRAEIEGEVKQQLAQRKFAESAEGFSNTIYEQSDSLKPAADKFKLQVKTAEAVSRTPDPQARGMLANPKFLAALFNPDNLRNKRNTEAVEIGPNQLVAGRVTQYTPAHRLSFAEVKDKVRAQVVAEQSAALARKEGESKLAAWKQGAATEALPPAVVVSRVDVKGLPRELLEAIMKAPANQLPTWVGVDLHAQGYAVVKLEKVLPRDPAMGDLARLQSQYAQVWGSAQANAYYDALKARYKAQTTGVAKAEAASSDTEGASR